MRESDIAFCSDAMRQLERADGVSSLLKDKKTAHYTFVLYVLYTVFPLVSRPHVF